MEKRSLARSIGCPRRVFPVFAASCLTRSPLNGLSKRRTSSGVVESAEYSVNTAPLFNPAMTVCVLAEGIGIAVSTAPSSSAQRETVRAAFLITI